MRRRNRRRNFRENRKSRRLREQDEGLTTEEIRERILLALDEFNSTYTDLELIEVDWNSNNFIDEEHLEVQVAGAISRSLEMEFWGDLIYQHEQVILKAPLIVDGNSVGVELEAVFYGDSWSDLKVRWR